MKTVKRNTNDQPWVIDEFSSLVGLRQYPVHYCSTVVFKYHKNNVNRSWMQLSQTFYSGVHTGDGLACFSANLCIQLWSAYCYDLCWKTKINHIRCEHILLVLQGYKAWNTSRTCCCTISTRPEFDFSSAGIRSYTVYFGRVHFQVNFTWRRAKLGGFWTTSALACDKLDEVRFVLTSLDVIHLIHLYYIKANRFENSFSNENVDPDNV